MSEVLQKRGKARSGMLLGVTSRLGWSAGSNPWPLWRLWDSFGIEQAQMISWCMRDTPVKSRRDDVLATRYVRKRNASIALASRAPDNVKVSLHVD